MKEPLTFGSLFAGIGGLDLGLERAGMRCAWQVEKDAYCRAVLAKHWPDVTRYEDVRDVGRANLAPVDLICGGFPCQDISGAGLRAGIDGPESGLWTEYARIVRELRPNYVVVENVARLLVDGMERVLGDLAACGYDAEWEVLPAFAVGAPHRRERVFIVAYPERERPDSGSSREGGTTRGRHHNAQRQHASAESGWQQFQPRTPRRDSSPLAYAERGRLEGGVFQFAQPPAELTAPLRRDRFGYHCGGTWESEPDVDLVVDGLPGRLAEPPISALGNAVVPQVAEYIGRLIVAADEAREEAA